MYSKKGEVLVYVGLVLAFIVLGSLAFWSQKSSLTASLTGASISIQHHVAGHYPQAVAVQMINTSENGFVITTSLARNINGSLVSNQNISLSGLGSFLNINISLIRNTTHGNIVNVSFAWQLARSNGSIMLNRTMVNTTANQSSFVQTVGFGLLPDGIYNVSLFIENLTVDGSTVGEINLSAAFEVGIDTVAPAVTQLLLNTSTALNASNFTNSGVLEFNITANDSTLTVQEVKLGYTNNFRNGTEVNITVPRNYSNYAVQLALSTLTDGLYSLIVYANDTVNNFNNSVANLSFRIDRTPPNVSVFLMNISNSTNIGGGLDDAGGVVQINATLNDSTTSVDTVKFGFYNVANGSRWNITATKQDSYWTINVEINRTCTGQHDITIYGNDTLNNLNNTVSNLTFRVIRVGSPPTTPSQCEGIPSPSTPSRSSSESGGSGKYTPPSQLAAPTAEQAAMAQQIQQPQQQQQQPQPTAEEIAQQRLQEKQAYVQNYIAVQTGEEQPAAEAETEIGEAVGVGTTTESLGETETETISITNSGSETFTMDAEVEAPSLPPLPNPQKAKEKLKEEVLAAFPDKSAEEIEQLLAEQIESLQLLEQENVQYLIGEQYSFGAFLGGGAGLTGGAVAVEPAAELPSQKPELTRQRLTPKQQPAKPSLSGIYPTKERIGGKLLKTELEGLDEIVVPPGATIEKEIQVRRGLSLSPQPIKISFVSEGQKMLQKELPAGKVVTGGAVDVDQEANTFDLYFVLPPSEKAGGAGTYQLELMIEKEASVSPSLPARLLALLLGRQKKHLLYSELFGPFHIPAQQGYIFAQQFAYDEQLYSGQMTLVTKVYRQGKIMAEQRYPVTLG